MNTNTALVAVFCALVVGLCACSDSDATQNTPPETSVSDAQNDARDDVEPELDVDGEDTAPDDVAVEEDTGPSTEFGCPTSYGFVQDAGAMQDERVTEASGIVASRQNPDVLWLHNDSGDAARLYALSTDGRALGRLRLEGVEAVDMEDIALAPCPQNAGDCLWVADVGNNARDRSTVTVYAVREPPVDASQTFGSTTTSTFWTYSLTYAGEPVDSEALVVTPDGSKLYLFEKVNGPIARVFTHTGPLTPGGDHTLESVTSFNAPGVTVNLGQSITGADLHPSGTRLVLRVYTGSYEYVGDPENPVSVEELVATTESSLVAAGPISEPQGEAIAYDAQGLGVWTVSEHIEQKAGEMLHYVPCRLDP